VNWIVFLISFLLCLYWFLYVNFVSSENRDNLISSILICIPFISFSCLIYLAKTLSTKDLEAWLKCLSCKHETLNSNLSTAKKKKKNSSTILNKSGENVYSCLVPVPEFKGNASSFSPFSIIWGKNSRIALVFMLSYVPPIAVFFMAFIIKQCWILLKAFSTCNQNDHEIMSLLLFMFCIRLLVCVCWTILAFLEWN
jgi:hypothetical protein